MTVAEQLAFAASKIPGNTVAWKVLFCITAFWTLLEIGFFLVVHFVMLPRVQKLTKAHPYHGDMMKMMRRSVDLVKQLHCYTFDKYLSGFCRGADFKDIHLENFRSFLTWAMYNKHLPEATPEELEKVAEVLAYAQQEHPVLKTMPPGFNPKVKHTRMTIDPIPIIHRPLLMYVLIRAKELIANTFYMPACGFQCLEVDGQTYWYKKQCGASDNTKSDDKNTVTGSTGKEPVLLLHGISTGWGNYVSMACALGAGRDIILVDMDAVKLNSLQFHMPTPQKFAESIVHILNRHNIDRVSLVGHSFGSMTAGWFLRHHPERVSHLTLLDPVSLLLSFPEVAYSFLYRKPSTLMEWVIHVFAAREITISHTLRRNFWWYNNDLWLEAIPEHIGVVVGLATHDEITNPKAVQEYVHNCRQARIQKRQRLAAGTTSSEKNVTRSISTGSEGSAATTTSTQSTDASPTQLEMLLATADSFSNLDALDASADSEEMSSGPVAMIECLVWDNYSHGQILAPSPEHTTFIATVRSNEKLGTATVLA